MNPKVVAPCLGAVYALGILYDTGVFVGCLPDDQMGGHTVPAAVMPATATTSTTSTGVTFFPAATTIVHDAVSGLEVVATPLAGSRDTRSINSDRA